MSNFIHLRDKSLEPESKGPHCPKCSSLPEDWDYTLSGLAVINRESKDAIRSAVNEAWKRPGVHQKAPHRPPFDAGGQVQRQRVCDLTSGNRGTARPTVAPKALLENRCRVSDNG